MARASENRASHRPTNTKPHDRGVIARISDQDTQFLRYATERGLMPGVEITVQSNDSVGDSVTVLIGDRSLTLGSTAAAKIYVAWQQ